MSTNLTDEMLPLVPRSTASAPRSGVESRTAHVTEVLRQNGVSLAALIGITAIVVYLFVRT